MPAYNAPMRILPPLAASAALATLLACSPEQNWRQLSFEGSTLKAQLPCKPDRTTREVPLGGVPVSLSVAGCEAGGAMLALMSAPLAPGADAQAVLAGWQQATLAHVPPAEPARSQAWQGHAWLPLAAAQRLQWQGRGADGQPLAAQAVWGAYAEGDHVRVVHAVVYAPKPVPELAQTLFEGLQP